MSKLADCKVGKKWRKGVCSQGYDTFGEKSQSEYIALLPKENVTKI